MQTRIYADCQSNGPHWTKPASQQCFLKAWANSRMARGACLRAARVLQSRRVRGYASPRRAPRAICIATPRRATPWSRAGPHLAGPQPPQLGPAFVRVPRAHRCNTRPSHLWSAFAFSRRQRLFAVVKPFVWRIVVRGGSLNSLTSAVDAFEGGHPMVCYSDRPQARLMRSA